MTYKISLPGEKIILDHLDPSQFDIERELGGSPYMTVSIFYVPHGDDKSTSINLGWVRIKMFQHLSETVSGRESGMSHETKGAYGRSQWVLIIGEETFPIHAGSVSEKHMQGQGPVTPSTEQTGEHLAPPTSLSFWFHTRRFDA